MARLVIVSNRTPNPHEHGPVAGGLAVAVADAMVPGSLWFGWSGQRGPTTEPETVQADGVTYATIDLEEAEYKLFYVGFANGALWPLLHFRLGLINFRREEYEAYYAVNRRFAAALAPLLRPDDLVWVHDYHLFPLGAELRRLGVTNRIGFFLHTHFVPHAVFAALPRAEQLIRDLCACDVVGFHTEEFQNDFLECVRHMLGVMPDIDGRFIYEKREVKAIVAPVGIDADRFTADAVRASRRVEAQRLRESMGGRALAIGVDRLDYSKGLPQRFLAFGRLLANFPQHRRGVNFLQVAARSREDVGDYQRLRRELDRMAGDTNGRYSEFDWTPLRYMTRTLKRATLAGFFRIARLGIVTPLRDGMNLVAKEYVAAQNPSDPGVLILSRFAGAADELKEALIVNPFDSDEIAEALHAGLVMDVAERRDRHQALLARVRHATARRFCEIFIAALTQSPMR
jgi:trehalose 6-phosphate synthase